MGGFVDEVANCKEVGWVEDGGVLEILDIAIRKEEMQSEGNPVPLSEAYWKEAKE